MIHKLSKTFLPVNIIPKNAQTNQDITSKSQRLMIELGIIKQANPGNFCFLPLGMRALEKLICVIDKEMKQIGAQKVTFPSLTSAKLWKTTGRLDENESELFVLRDRHHKNYVLSPTYEEAATNLLASIAPTSYKQFPLKLYQITSKYRDEIRPRFGLMRARQFIMKDLYSFDIDLKTAQTTYEEVTKCYDLIFKNIGIEFVKVLGATGMMGGSLSHEYHYITNVGEDRLVTCLSCGYASNLELLKSEKQCPACGKADNHHINLGIEVGHTFLLGKKYSEPLNANYISESKKLVPLCMGSYGLGVSRIISAAIEVLSSEQEIRWPIIFAPFTVIIIPPKEGSKEEHKTRELPEKLYKLLESIKELKDNIIIDDRKYLTIGRRHVDARKLGFPYILVVGSKATEESPLFELNCLKDNSQLFLNEAELLNYFKEKL